MSVRDLLIVGAGPSGLSAAIAAKQNGLDYLVLEQGTLVNSIYNFPPQMVFFTTPELLEIGGLPFVSPYEKPTRAEALKYYRKVVDSFDLQIAFEETVLSVAREDHERAGEAGGEETDTLFAVETRSSRGIRRVCHARFVVLAIGYYDHPNLLNVPGEDLPHVHHYYREPHPHYRQRVVIVGGGNSAAESALEMFRSGAHVTLVHRWPALKSTIKYWVKPDIENRIKEGSIAARFNTCVREIRPTSIVVSMAPQQTMGDHMWGAPHTRGRESTPEAEEQRSNVGERERGPAEPMTKRERASSKIRSVGDGSERGWGPASIEKSQAGEADGKEELPADAVYLLTGYHPDWDLLTRAGVNLNDRGAPAYNPDTFETNVPGLFVAGGVVSGKDTAPIFIENGRFHGEQIVKAIIRDRRV